MANLKDLIVNGAARIIGKTYSSEFVGDVTGNVTGDVSGNADTATKLKTARSLKITDDGTNTSTGVDFDGSDTVTLKLPSTIKASITGNATTATTADKTAYGISVGDGVSSTAAISSWKGSEAKTLAIKGTSPITTTATTDTITITHNKGGANVSKGDTTDQTPGFGGTFKVTSATVDVYGHTTELAHHTVTIPSSVATTSANGLMSSADKTKLSGIAESAEVNQNAFSNVTVGSTTISADSKTDTLTLEAGSNVTITPDATNDKITISSTDTTNVSATTTGSGNAVTSVTASGSTITVTKGTTFLTSHQDISGKEDKSNKVTAWSSTATDTHYPSEKLVKTALDGINTVIGDINSILDNINGEVI